MRARALSDPKVVEASERFVCVEIDRDRDKRKIGETWNIRATPTLMFLDPEGRHTGEVVGGILRAEEVERALAAVAEKHSRSLEAAIKTGREEKKPVAMLWTDAGDTSVALRRAVGDAALKGVAGKFVWTRAAFHGKDDELAKKYGVASAPQLLVLDAKSDDPAAAPLKRIEGAVAAEELKKQLEALAGK